MKLNVNGVYYHVEVSGEGEPLLLLHGFAGSLENWRPFLKLWSSYYYVVMIDILGHGKSDKPIDALRYNIEQMAFDINILLEKLGIKITHVLGYSMGGRIALTLAIKYPNRVASLILESSSPGLAGEQERNQRIKKDEDLADFIENKGIVEFVDYWEKLPLFSSQQALPADIKINIRSQRLNNSTCGLANSLRGMGTGKQPSWWSYLDQIKIPVYLIVGEKDEKFARIAQSMAKKILDAKTVVVEKTGHAVHVEYPGLFGELVIQFLQSFEENKRRDNDGI